MQSIPHAPFKPDEIYYGFEFTDANYTLKKREINLNG